MYQLADSKEELTDLYVQNSEQLLKLSEQCGLSGGIYTQITDVADEVNGFYTYDRQVQKMFTKPVRDINERLSHSGNFGTAPEGAPLGTPGLDGVHAWNADEGSGTTAADQVGGRDLTLMGNAGWTDGKSGSALSFDGNGSAETDGPVVDTTGSFSVSAWVKLDGTGGGFSTALSQDGDASSAFFLQYDGGQNKFAFSTMSGRAYADTTATPGTWYHLVGVRDATVGTCTLYLDGAEQGSFGQCLGGRSTGPLAVGRAEYNGDKVDRLRGDVDDVRVYDQALTAADVQRLYAKNGADRSAAKK